MKNSAFLQHQSLTIANHTTSSATSIFIWQPSRIHNPPISYIISWGTNYPNSTSGPKYKPCCTLRIHSYSCTWFGAISRHTHRNLQKISISYYVLQSYTATISSPLHSILMLVLVLQLLPSPPLLLMLLLPAYIPNSYRLVDTAASIWC